MCFYEKAIGAGGKSSLCDRSDQLRIAAGDPAGLIGLLQGMRAIHDDRGAMFLHPGDIAVVYYQILVAECRASFCEDDTVVPCLFYFFDCELHGRPAEELAFFYIDYFTGLCGGDEEVCLAAEEGWDLEDVDGFAYGGAVLGGVNVGEDGEAGGFGYGAQDAATFGEAGAAEAADRGAVGFVVAGFEDVGDAEIGGDALDGVGHGAGVGFGLDDAGAGDEEELATAYGDVADVEWISHIFI